MTNEPQPTNDDPAVLVHNEINDVIAFLRANVHRHLAMIAFIEKYRSVFEQHGVMPTHYPHSVDIDNPSREDALRLMQAFGGKWQKTVNGINIDYCQEIDGVTVRLWSTPPPPSCRIVEVEEVVPAEPEKRVMKRKLVCIETEGEGAI
jgi:hypothetical protein